jgi:hypothetical protein
VRCLLDGCQVCVNKTLQTTKLVRGLQSCPSCFVSLEPFSAMPSFPSYLSGSSAVWGHLTCGKLATFLFLPRWKFLFKQCLTISTSHTHTLTHTHTHTPTQGTCRGTVEVAVSKLKQCVPLSLSHTLSHTHTHTHTHTQTRDLWSNSLLAFLFSPCEATCFYRGNGGHVELHLEGQCIKSPGKG